MSKSNDAHVPILRCKGVGDRALRGDVLCGAVVPRDVAGVDVVGAEIELGRGQVIDTKMRFHTYIIGRDFDAGVIVSDDVSVAVEVRVRVGSSRSCGCTKNKRRWQHSRDTHRQARQAP